MRRPGLVASALATMAAVVLAGCPARSHRAAITPKARLGHCSVPIALGSARAGFSPGGSLPTSESDANVERDLAGMRGVGAGWVRVDFNWAAIERSPGRYNWGHLDAVVAGARCHGLRILALPAYTPVWARPGATSDKTPPTDPSTYASFVAAAADHFGDRVAAWELWNEPNISQFWQPRPDPLAYGRLLRAAASALRTAHPTTTILSAGLAPVSGAEMTFLNSVIDSGGLGPVDGVAIHAYSYPGAPADGSSAFSRLPTIHDALVSRGLRSMKVWVTEMGAPTGRSRASVTDGLQAVSVAQAFSRWGSPDWRPWTGALIWYSWRDSGGNRADAEQNFGLLREDGTPKPSLGAYRDAVAAA